jgi:aminoglycoside/choline kinase family phosphotransferase
MPNPSLAGDASFRRYFRVHAAAGKNRGADGCAAAHEDIGPFLTVAGHLLDRGFSPPRPLAIDRRRGLLLLEDFGDDGWVHCCLREPDREIEIYEVAVDILARIAAQPAPKDLPFL